MLVNATEACDHQCHPALSLMFYLDGRVVIDSAVKGAVCLHGERHGLRADSLQLVERLALGVPPEVLPLLIEAEVGGPLRAHRVSGIISEEDVGSFLYSPQCGSGNSHT